MNEDGATHEYHVPAIAESLMEALVSDDSLREAVVGDLREEYQGVASREGVGVANRWYWSQVGRSVIPFAAISVSHGSTVDKLRFLAGVLSGYGVIIWLLVLSLWTVGWVFAFLDQGGFASGLVTFGETPRLVVAWSLVMAAVSGVAGGFVAARVGDRTAAAAAITLGLLGIPLCAFTVVPDIATAPTWFQIALSVFLLPSVTGGALLCRKATT